jgi:anti-sigma B factor antagonist
MIDWNWTKVGPAEDILLFELNGQLDADACEYLFKVLEHHIKDGDINLILECRDLDFISSLGLGMLVRVHAKMKKCGGEVCLSSLQGMVADVISLVGLDKLLRLYRTSDEAIESYAARDSA